MNRNLSNLAGFNIVTEGGIKAKIKDFLFDENSWTIRYVEVDFGNIFTGKRVLIPNALFKKSQLVDKEFYLNITNNELENCPKPDENLPISQKYEEELFKYYQLDYYWTFSGAIPRNVPEPEIDEYSLGTTLRSYNEVKGYSIHTLDGSFGKLDDLIVDDNSWEITYVIIDTSKWLPLSKKVALDIIYIQSISYKNKEAKVLMQEHVLQHAPEYSTDEPFDNTFQSSLHEYYLKNMVDTNI